MQVASSRAGSLQKALQLRSTQQPFRAAAACRVAAVSRRAGRSTGLQIHARLASFGGSQPFTDRVIAALPYVLPFFNAFTYGRYLFHMYPVLRSVIKPILPAVASFHNLPFASMIAFFGLYLGVANNRTLSRFVRFNAMQALLLDILLVLPRLLESIFSPPTSGWGLQMYAHSQSFVWVFTTTWVVFCVASTLMGTWGRIPFIADAADQQVR